MLSHFSPIRLCDPMDYPLSIEFPRQECWRGLPCLPPGDLPDPGIEPESLMSPALAGGLFTASATWEAVFCKYIWFFPASAFSFT